MLINYLEREKSIFECIKYQILNISPESSVLIVDFRSPNFMIQLLAFQPETLLMFPLTAKTISYIPYILKAAFKTKIISYRTEGIFPATSYDQLESFAGQGCYGPCCIDAELFWGKENVIKIANLLYKQKKISSLASVLLDMFHLAMIFYNLFPLYQKKF